MRRIGRGVPTLLSFGLFLSVGTLLFLMARPHYLPSRGQFWCVLGAGSTVCSGITGPQDIAMLAGVPLPVLVASAALNSTFLAGLAAGAALVSGIPFGFWLAIHAPRPLSELLRSATNVGIALPAFFVAFLLQVAAVELSRGTARPLVPTFGFGIDAHLIIPVLALAAAPFAYVTRLVAIGAADLDARDFVRTARAKGLSEMRVVYRHIAPNMVGALSEAALGALRLVLGALVIVEYLVSWPGIGYLLLRAVRAQDGAVLLAGITVLGMVFLLLERGIDVLTERTGVVTG